MENIFGDASCIAVLPADSESNVDNHVGSRVIGETPMEEMVFVGMGVTLKKNLNKEVGYVNGMVAKFFGMNNDGLTVRSGQDRTISIFPWTFENHAWVMQETCTRSKV